MMMPRMGGYPVLEHFRGKTDAPPIIMITANEGSRHKVYAEYLGVIDYIRKPFAMDRLLESVHKALTNPRPTDSPAPAAGIILTFGPSSVELFMVRRAPKLRFFGGFWAFPGGKVDDADGGSA